MGTTGIYRPPLPPAARLRRAGARMRRIRTSKPGVIWLQGPGPCDLWTYADAEAGPDTPALELTFFGRTVVLRGGHLLTGLSHEGVSASYTGSTGLLDFDRVNDAETLVGADHVLDGIPDDVHTPATRELRRAIQRALAGPSAVKTA